MAGWARSSHLLLVKAVAVVRCARAEGSRLSGRRGAGEQLRFDGPGSRSCQALEARVTVKYPRPERDWTPGYLPVVATPNPASGLTSLVRIFLIKGIQAG